MNRSAFNQCDVKIEIKRGIQLCQIIILERECRNCPYSCHVVGQPARLALLAVL